MSLWNEMTKMVKLSKVIAHIAGPSGAGKSTLLGSIKDKHPHIIAKDLDDFDEEAEKELKFKSISKKDYTDSMLKRLAVRRQKLMDVFLKVHKNDQVVLGGHHLEDKHFLKIPTENKYLLNTGPVVSARRAYNREFKEDKYDKESVIERTKINQTDIKNLKELGYKSMSPTQILKHITKTASNLSEALKRRKYPVVAGKDLVLNRKAGFTKKFTFHTF